MRHVPESLVNPLLGILSEYEAGVRAKPKRTLKDLNRLREVSCIRQALTKKYNDKRAKSEYGKKENKM